MERKISIEADGIYKEDYQMQIVKSSHIEGLLHMRGQGVEGQARYDYEVSGKVSVKAMYERAQMRHEDLELFLTQLAAVIKETKRHLLNIDCILLEPEYVFYEAERFFFCYYPHTSTDIWSALRKLTDYFVKKTDYKDPVCVQMVFALHKGVSEENYSLQKVTEDCVEAAKEKGYEQWKKEKEKHREIFEYDTTEHDWISEQEMGGKIMEETENLWTPVKKFLNKHKKVKWGDFDGLHIEHEE